MRWDLDLGRLCAVLLMIAVLTTDDNILVSLTADVATTYVLSRTADKRLDIARRHLDDTLATDPSTLANL